VAENSNRHRAYELCVVAETNEDLERQPAQILDANLSHAKLHLTYPAILAVPAGRPGVSLLPNTTIQVGGSNGGVGEHPPTATPIQEYEE
jgi:hypothetical protein